MAASRRHQAIISHSLVRHFDLSFAIRNRLLLTASLPVAFLESGEAVSGSGITPAGGAYVSDPRLGATVRLYGQPYANGFSASLGGQVWLPLRAITDSLPEQASDQSVRGMFKLILGGYKSHVLWSANLGVLLRPLAQIGDVMSPVWPHRRSTKSKPASRLPMPTCIAASRLALKPSLPPRSRIARFSRRRAA